MFDPKTLFPARTCAVMELDDERLLYDADAGVLHLLNSTASTIWALCDGRHDVAEITALLRRRYAVPSTCNLEEHVQATICDLVERRLLVAPSG